MAGEPIGMLPSSWSNDPLGVEANPVSAEEQQRRRWFWGNAKPPTQRELEWIESFGKYMDYDPSLGKLSARLSLEVASLRQATQVIVYHHYLHRGRTMAQLPYWIRLDQTRVGVVLFAYPRLSVPLFGIQPMNLLELARLWISPTVQGLEVVSKDGRHHALSVASCALAEALRKIRYDWYAKYPGLPDVDAVVSWADTLHHEGTIYRATNFQEMGASGGSMHGKRRRPNGGRDKLNPDYRNIKTLFLYRFAKRLSTKEKSRFCGQAADLQARQIELWPSSPD
jgi:hypothetical protein